MLLTAREEVRQARRTGQAVKGVGAEDVAARDKADSKVTSFLTAADGVTTIDNSDLDFAHTLDLLIGLVEDAIENQEYEQYAANLEGYELDEGDEDLISGRGFTEGARKAGPKPVGVLAVRTWANHPWSTVSSAAVPPLWKTRRALRETV